MVRALGVEGKVHAGIFAILPEKISGGLERRRYADFSLFPAALRDLAVVVNVDDPAEEVQKAIVRHARAAVGSAFALEGVQVFDVYRGSGLPEGKKSLAFGLVFRAKDRTLTDDEVNAVMLRTQEELVKATGYGIRK
jgi:phenylalanyl-tRNA synthetase beta chain